ncbi:hypothetical protein H2200_007782 [Cladophialophora chaetospira]|uniref:AB hydrolase-1 domain-containing protein n=1 Tax=Cladophialophora chaetospira TaxID=386627 RepID=A0AA38X6H3_9EURO|nr:hypothetical protein H2200_007782 [Cladophialophora chaetospira]
MAEATPAITRHEHIRYGKTWSYLAAGPENGPLMIFIHGWPGIAETWKPQITAFAALGFRCIAPDMPGYGQSTPKNKEKTDYSLQNIIDHLLMFLKHGLQRDEAIWVGHDWGAGVVWALVAHSPEMCLGVVNMSVPYRTLEMGLNELVKYANRDIYPEDEFPHAQWSYQAFYETSDENYEKAISFFDKNVERFLKAVYSKPHDVKESRDKPAFTANVVKDGGWFGGAEEPPDVPLEATLLSEDLLASLVKAFKEGGFWAPTAYYLNHEANLKWCEDWSINEGLVNVPCLFVECLNDTVVATHNTKIMDPMKAYCRKLTTVSIDAGHWVALEKPEETNAAILRWIARELPEGRAWPFGKKNPLKTKE